MSPSLSTTDLERHKPAMVMDVNLVGTHYVWKRPVVLEANSLVRKQEAAPPATRKCALQYCLIPYADLI